MPSSSPTLLIRCRTRVQNPASCRTNVPKNTTGRADPARRTMQAFAPTCIPDTHCVLITLTRAFSGH
eukprot:4064540-Pyramimonas_sp.AAC.1